MNIQDGIVYVIVGLCIVLIVLRLWRTVAQAKRGFVPCAGCPLEKECLSKTKEKQKQPPCPPEYATHAELATHIARTKGTKCTAKKNTSCGCK